MRSLFLLLCGIFLNTPFVSAQSVSGSSSERYCSGSTCCRSCVRFSNIKARCHYPSSNYIKNAIEREVEKDLIDQLCTKIKIKVRTKQANEPFASNITTTERHVSVRNVNNDPFKFEVTGIDAACETEIPVQISVRAYDRHGVRRDESYVSRVKVRGQLR